VQPAVVIVNWNSGPRLKACLESLPEDSHPVVVDNASEDGSIQIAKQSRIRAVIIENSTNRGLAAAINQGFAATSTDYVLLLNPDVLATPGAIETLGRILKDNPRAGAVGGYVNDRYLPRPLASPWTVVRENLGLPAAALDAETVGQTAAAAVLVRREAWRSAGGFDEQFFPAWYEDVDFCKSLSEAGWEVRFARKAQFIHEGGYSAKALGASNFAEAYYRNQIRYIRKHFGAAATLLVRLSIVAGMAARAVAKPSRAGACSKVIAGALGGW
jgi:GT2 family glycosyltransferase